MTSFWTVRIMVTFNTSQGNMSKRDPNCYLILLPLFRCEAIIPRIAVLQEWHICKNRINRDRIVLLFVCLVLPYLLYGSKCYWNPKLLQLWIMKQSLVILWKDMKSYEHLDISSQVQELKGKRSLGSCKVHPHSQWRDGQ